MDFVIEGNTPALMMIDVPVVQNRVNESSVYADIMNRADRPELGNSRSTNGHETVHQLNSQLRNARGGGSVNAFYLLEGKAVILVEPKVTLAQVCEFIPKSLQESRYRLYCVEQRQYWDKQPLYLCDEWTAYCAGCAVALDDYKSGRGKENTDEAVGPLELGIYAVAMAMAVEQHDPEYFQRESQFKAFMVRQWKATHDLFEKASPVFPWDTQERMLKALNDSPDADKMRQFIRKHLGGVWLNSGR